MKRKTLALIAHDTKKDDMVSLVKANRDKPANFELAATGGTGQMVKRGNRSGGDPYAERGSKSGNILV